MPPRSAPMGAGGQAAGAMSRVVSHEPLLTFGRQLAIERFLHIASPPDVVAGPGFCVKGLVVKAASVLRCLLVACWVSMAVPAAAQREQFPTPVQSPAVPPTPAAPVGGPVASPAPPTYTPMPGAAPMSPLTPPPTYAAPAAPTPIPGAAGAGVPAASPTAPYAAPTYGAPAPYAPPPANFNGTIQPPTGWDPYAAPVAPPGTLLPQDPYFPCGPQISMAAMQKFVQHVDFNYDWFAGHGENELGINDVNLDVTFAIPLFQNIATPLLITPGFAVHYWEGPVSVPPEPADLPPRTYDAYLDFCWNPQISPWFGAELNFRTGLYSDFDVVSSAAFRFMGKGLAVIRLSDHMVLKAGVWYIDRVLVKILPAGGLVWTPNPDVYFDILFPNPKIGKRLATLGTTEWWLIADGCYGGGSWFIRRNSGLAPPGPADGTETNFDYNDVEIAVGLEFRTVRHLDGLFEIGGSFSRQLVYQDNQPQFYFPNSTVFIRAGLTY